MTIKPRLEGSLPLKNEDMNSSRPAGQLSTKSMQQSDIPEKKIFQIDLLMLEDEIQSIHNKLEYVRDMDDDEIKVLKAKLASHSYVLNELTASINL